MPPAKAIDALAEDYLAIRKAHGFSQRLTMPEALLVQKSFVRKLQPKLGKPARPINPSGPSALSESDAKAFVEGVETAQDA